MATEDGFRLVPSDHAEIAAQLDSATAWRGEMVRAAVLGASAAAIALAFVSLVDPNVLLTKATTLLASISQNGKLAQASIFRTGTEMRSSARVQAITEAQASPLLTGEPAATDTPTNNDIAAPVKTAEQSQTETGPSAEQWLGRFQTWAAQDPAPPEAQPTQAAALQPAPEQPAPEIQAKPAADSVKTPVRAPRVQDARAEIEPAARSHHSSRQRKQEQAELREKQERKQARRARQLRREQHARLLVRSAQDAQDQAPEPPRPPTFLESIGIHQ